MKKIGYYVKTSYDYHTDLFETTIVGEMVSEFIGERWPASGHKLIWSSRPLKESPYKDDPNRAAWVENIFFSLDEAKQKVVDDIAASRNILHGRQKELTDVDNLLINVDLATLPRDEYISPFTGKKT